MSIFTCLVQAKFMEAAQQTQYVAPVGAATVAIDNMSVTNNSAGSVVIAANIVPSGGVAGASNKVLQDTTLAPGVRHEYLLQGEYLNAEDSISTLCNTASAVVMRINGRVIP